MLTLNICLMLQATGNLSLESNIVSQLNKVIPEERIIFKSNNKENHQSSQQCDIHLIFTDMEGTSCQHLTHDKSFTIQDNCECLGEHFPSCTYWSVSLNGGICDYPFVSVKLLGAMNDQEIKATAINILNLFGILPSNYRYDDGKSLNQLTWSTPDISCNHHLMDHSLSEILMVPSFYRRHHCLRNKLVTEYKLFTLWPVVIVTGLVFCIINLYILYKIVNNCILHETMCCSSSSGVSNSSTHIRFDDL